MKLPALIRHSDFLHRLTHWEHWPMQVFLFPVVGMWVSFMIRARAIAFFTAANPSIHTGGMFGESKGRILDMVPDSLVPRTLLLSGEDKAWSRVEAWMQRGSLNFPLIGKPDIGERGFGVSKLENAEEVSAYLAGSGGDILIQEFIDLPLELSVMFYHFPGESHGYIPSVTIKEPLAVIGDGKSTLAELITEYPRARMQWPRLRRRWADREQEIPAPGQVIQLDFIGNHCRGSTFRDGNSLIDNKLHDLFNDVVKQMDGVYLGRFDLKCESVEAMKAGKFKVLEFNGVAAEPAHLYDPQYSLWQAYRDYYRHCRTVYRVSQAVRARGAEVMTTREILSAYRAYRRALKEMSAI
jgi:hypothetical protein